MRTSSSRVHLILLPLLMLVTDPAHAQLRLSRLISDGMVMQRGAEVPVWGWANPGEAVAVTFEGRTYTAQADSAGAWAVRLPAMRDGGPYKLAVESGGERIGVQDILFGDVWVASGQSNMEWTVADSREAAKEIAAASDPWIRHFKVPRSWAEQPEDDLAGGSWEAADPQHVGSFSAVAYFFARDLRKHVEVPIGIINSTWGGSRIEPWMSEASLEMEPGALEAVMAEERAAEERVRDALRAKLGDLPTQDAGLVNGDPRWADPALDVSAWLDIQAPGLWEQQGYEGMNGIAWYRTAFELSPEEASTGVRLGLGMIDDSDIAFLNGEEIGRMENAHATPRVYDVPASLLRPGRNVVAVRVEDTGGGGGIHGSRELLFIDVKGKRRPLADVWKFKVGAVVANSESQKNQIPTLLYNKMVHPLLPYPIKGVIWYQGESNTGGQDAFAYRTQLANMIRDWRARWGVGDFPFLFVQLANFMQPDAEPAESGWAVLRESQTATLSLPNTAQAVIIDLGEADDIHPRNKQDVGARLALAARKLAYGEDVVYSGPLYRSHELRNGRVYLDFDHVGGGLVAKGGMPGGFAIAGENGHFVWANATIEGDRVVVWSDAVPDPVAVRYAWGNNPDRANLYNTEDLPANPFRTDQDLRTGAGSAGPGR